MQKTHKNTSYFLTLYSERVNAHLYTKTNERRMHMSRRYSNLEAEIARKGVSKKEIAETLGVRLATVYNKLKGKCPFTLDEAFKIRNKHFPDFTLEYLFYTEE